MIPILYYNYKYNFVCVVFDFFQKQKIFHIFKKKKLNFENPKQHLLVERSPPREGGEGGVRAVRAVSVGAPVHSGLVRGGCLGESGWEAVQVVAPKGGEPGISHFFPLSSHKFLSFFPLFRGLLVEFWWRLKRWGLEMCMSGVLGLSCEAPVCPESFHRRRGPGLFRSTV